MKYTVGTYIVGKSSGDIKAGEKVSINKVSKIPSDYGTISVFFWKDEYSDRFDPSELDDLQLKKINNSPEYGGGIDESASKLKKILKNVLNENIESDSAREMLSLLASPEFKKYKDKLGDEIGHDNFLAFDKLYDALYAELKKYD